MNRCEPRQRRDEAAIFHVMAASATVLNLEGDRLHVPVAALHHAGFRAWVTADDFPDAVRATFVEGEVFIEMSPEAIESHNKVELKVSSVILRVVESADLGEVYADRTLLTNETIALSTEPDLTFASWATLESRRLRRVPKANRADEYIELEGSPDLVVEVVSDSSVRKDLKLLRSSYARAAIAEYWIIDARGDDVHFEILCLSGPDYVGHSPPSAPQRSTVLKRTFTLSRHKNRIGSFNYALDVSS